MNKELNKRLKEVSCEFHEELALKMYAFLIIEYPKEISIELLKLKMQINYKALNKVLEQETGFYSLVTNVEDEDKRTTDEMFISLDQSQYIYALKKLEKKC